MRYLLTTMSAVSSIEAVDTVHLSTLDPWVGLGNAIFTKSRLARPGDVGDKAANCQICVL